ncbi:MAG: hypothetical protein ACRC14_01545 [Paracoccaceae bacterium]
MTATVATGRTLWLHVGTHKTGTTSLQYALRRKRGILAKTGVKVWPEQNAWRLANLFLRPTMQSNTRAKGNAVPPTLAEIRAAHGIIVGNLGDFRQMIISSEQFCMLRQPIEAFGLSSILGDLFDRIIPIVTFRNDADWRASWQGQIRRAGVWEFQTGLPDDQSANGDWYYDRAAIIAFWQDFGPVRVVDYDAACARDGSILPAMAEALDQPGLFADQSVRLNAREPGELQLGMTGP